MKNLDKYSGKKVKLISSGVTYVGKACYWAPEGDNEDLKESISVDENNILFEFSEDEIDSIEVLQNKEAD